MHCKCIHPKQIVRMPLPPSLLPCVPLCLESSACMCVWTGQSLLNHLHLNLVPISHHSRSQSTNGSQRINNQLVTYPDHLVLFVPCSLLKSCLAFCDQTVCSSNFLCLRIMKYIWACIRNTLSIFFYVYISSTFVYDDNCVHWNIFCWVMNHKIHLWACLCTFINIKTRGLHRSTQIWGPVTRPRGRRKKQIIMKDLELN